MTEEGDEIVIDVTVPSSGIGIKLYYTPWGAHVLGQGIMEKARFAVAKASDDPARTQAFEDEASDAKMRKL